jgi:hypothetical protein
MATRTSVLALKAAVLGATLLIASAGVAQAVQSPPQGATAQHSTAPSPVPRPTSSNSWDSLPEMSVNRCLAEAIGTAADPKTGAPSRVSVDPQTGKPLCPPPEARTSTTPPR